MNRTLHSNAHVKTGLLVVQSGATATTKGTEIDRFNYRDAIIHANVANATGTPTKTAVNFKLQHSDTTTDGDFVDVDIQGIESTFAVDKEGEAELHVNLDGFKQYIRVVATAALTGGTTPKVDVIGTVVLGNMVSNPVRG